MVIEEFGRKHPHLFHTLSALLGGSVSSIFLGFACIPLYQRLFAFNLAEAVYLTSITFFVIYMFVLVNLFAMKSQKVIWLFSVIVSACALLLYVVLR